MIGRMHLGIAGKLALVLALVGALAAGVTGFYVYQASHRMLLAAAEAKLLTSTQVVARRITQSREAVSGDLKFLARLPESMLALTHGDPKAMKTLQTVFKSMMEANPAYLQVRLIAGHSHGLELVRVDRDARDLVVVGVEDLQEKGHYPYVSETLKLDPGTTYLSRIAINHERGAASVEGQPSIILAMPVVDMIGMAHGVVVVNLNLQGLFLLLGADLPPQFQLFLANGEGDILVHPNRDLMFAFDRGQRELIQTHMPPMNALFGGDADQLVFELASGPYAKEPLVAAFIRQPIAVASEESRMYIGLAQSRSTVLSEAADLWQSIVQIVLGICLGCLAMAVWLARALTRPINAIGEAARRLAEGHTQSDLPIHRQDEVGDLARNFGRMQDQIMGQMATLQSRQQELAELARQDELTGLPNRRLFEEHLEAAMAQHRRTGESRTVLFVDLDHFKQINDSEGHEVGDGVLKTVARRLKDSTREVDTPARLGGDEFVILLGTPVTDEQVAAFAQKLLLAVSAPIHLDERLFIVGCSIGISRCPADGTTAEALLSAADGAMYQAKQAGRSAYRFASGSEGGH